MDPWEALGHSQSIFSWDLGGITVSFFQLLQKIALYGAILTIVFSLVYMGFFIQNPRKTAEEKQKITFKFLIIFVIEVFVNLFAWLINLIAKLAGYGDMAETHGWAGYWSQKSNTLGWLHDEIDLLGGTGYHAAIQISVWILVISLLLLIIMRIIFGIESMRTNRETKQYIQRILVVTIVLAALSLLVEAVVLTARYFLPYWNV